MTQVLTNVPFLVMLAFTVPAVVGSIAVAWQKIRKAEVQAALKQSMVERGMTVEAIERVVYPPAPPEAPLSEEAAYRVFGECLAHADISGPTLEQLAATFRAADLATKRGLAQTLQGIVDAEGDLSENRVLPLVRGFCGAGMSTAIRPAREAELAT